MINNTVNSKINARSFYLILILIIIITDAAVLLDLLLLNYFFGFIFLTILPGLLIIQMLELRNISSTEKLVLSVGLSISFLMFIGLLINNFSLVFGYGTPLTTGCLLTTLNVILIILIVMSYRIKKESILSMPDFNLTISEKSLLIIPAMFPVLSVLGMNILNISNKNIVLISLLILISVYIIFSCYYYREFPARLYPIIIFLISISLLLLASLRSNHILGVDAHSEYNLFRSTLDCMQLVPSKGNPLDACLSVSILPVIYQSILITNPEYLFKILYSLIFSISPLVIYALSKKYIEESYAFIASIFFMSQYTFLWTEYNALTNTAILFFALAIMTIFNDNIDPLKKRILFIVFIASCIVSHYSTTYIFFIVILATLIGTEILSQISSKIMFSQSMNFRMVTLFFVLIFLWYSQLTNAAFDYGMTFIMHTIDNLSNFFIEESRGQAQAIIGVGIMLKGVPHKIEFFYTWLTFIFIGIGIFTLIIGYIKASFIKINFEKPNYLKIMFEPTLFIIVLVCAGLLALMIALPYVAVGYSIDRLYSMTATVLSVFFVIGGLIVSNHIIKVLPFEKVKRSEHWMHIFILLVLIPYFYCVTGVVYNMFDVPRSVLLNSEGDQYDQLYVHDMESYGAKWVKEYHKYGKRIYTDFWGRLRLISQAGLSQNSLNWYDFSRHKEVEGYIYLTYYNIINKKLIFKNESTTTYTYYKFAEYDDIFIKKNKLYSNAGSEVYL